MLLSQVARVLVRTVYESKNKVHLLQRMAYELEVLATSLVKKLNLCVQRATNVQCLSKNGPSKTF